MKFSVLTLGCKANQAESFMIEANLRSFRHEIVGLNEKPDICIINTCTVTLKSDYQSRHLIRRAHRAGSRVVVTGCYSELNRDEVSTMESVMMVVGNDNKSSIINILTGINADNTLSYTRDGKSRFFVKVQDGCNFSCSYCIIPKARGRSRSLKINNVLEQVKAASINHQEVVLTGIHLGTYGHDLTPRIELSDLVRAILNETCIRRIRLSSLEINEIKEDILELMKEERFCKHLHIPLQSGDDNILRIMNRNYNSKAYIKGIELIHKVVPDISTGTDIIAGFPGEGDKEFRNTKDLIDAMPLTYLHVFPFSPRPGTKAADIGNNIESAVKRERCGILIALGKRKKHDYMKKQIGKTLDPLIEERCSDGAFIGTTGNYLKVKAFINKPSLKSIVNVRVEGFNDMYLFGSHVSDS